MPQIKRKSFWIAGGLCCAAFLALFAIRMGVFDALFFRPKTLPLSAMGEITGRDNWMNIFQNNRKIGFSHSRLAVEDTGYRLDETVFMRINTMGMIQDINLKTQSRLNPDFTLADFNFEISSGRFQFTVQGLLEGNVFRIQTESAGSRRTVDIPLKNKPYLLAGLVDAVASTGLRTGDRYIFDIFDPATMSQQPITVEVIGRENIEVAGSSHHATKISLNFKGYSQLAWLGNNGELLQEKGLLGIRLQKTNRENALSGLKFEASQDLTQVASVPSNIKIQTPARQSSLTVEINGISFENLHLHGERQSLKQNTLTIVKEALTDLPESVEEENLGELEKIFLQPSPFIQSDNEKVIDRVNKILGTDTDLPPVEKARKLLDWVYANIEKRPVLSLPDALSTLENKIGDCNEHAVLLAALARAAGIPCRVEAGLVYLNGSFYYHAWNLLYLGRWITADSLFGQMPADVTHIRFISGSQQQQLDLMAILGNVKLTVTNYSADSCPWPIEYTR